MKTPLVLLLLAHTFVCAADAIVMCIYYSLEMEEQIREAWPQKCCFVVKEIMQTEIAYVQALADIIKVSQKDWCPRMLLVMARDGPEQLSVFATVS